MLGSFGDVTFEVSSDRIRTWNDLQRSGKARWAAHELVQEKPVLQYVGPDLEEISFTVRLDAGLGLAPASELDALRKIRDEAEPQPLTIGGQPYGKFVLESLSESQSRFDNKGNLFLAVVSLSLKEYHEREEDPAYRQGLTGVPKLLDAARTDSAAAVGDAKKGVTEVPDEAVDEVAAQAEDAGGGFKEKLGKAAEGLKEAAKLAEGGVSGLVSKGLDKMGLDAGSLGKLAESSPIGAVADVVQSAGDLADAVSLGAARSALSDVLGSDAASVAEKFMGRSGELKDVARFADLGWLDGVDAASAFETVDTGLGRSASLAGKVARLTEVVL